MTLDQIMPTLTEILCEILSVEPEEVTLEANFFDMLGGESLEVLELSFHCEKRFGVRIDFKSLFDPTTININTDGSIPAETVTGLKKQFPFIDFGNASKPQQGNVLQSLFTIRTIAGFIQQGLDQKEIERQQTTEKQTTESQSTEK